MRALAWLPALALLPAVPFLFFPEHFGLALMSPWFRLALVLAAAGLAGALGARLERDTAALRVGVGVAAPTAAVGGALGVMTAMAPEHLLLVAFGTVGLIGCAALGAGLARGGQP